MLDDSLRVFVAMEPSDALQSSLRELQARLKQLPAGRVVRFVAPQNIHLTFKFLGNVEKGTVPNLIEALKAAASGSAPMALTARGLGCFPNPNRPNNLWVGLDGDLDGAALLAHKIEAEFERMGVPRDERGFTPHLTLGRIKRDAANEDRVAVGKWVKESPAETYGEIQKEAVYLIASDLRPSGPIYNVLARVVL